MPNSEGDNPVHKLVNLILLDSIKKAARRIVIDTDASGEYAISVESGGVLRKMMTPPLSVREAIRDRLLEMAEAPLPRPGEASVGRIHISLRASQTDAFFDLALLPGSGHRLVLLCRGDTPPSGPPRLDMFAEKPLPSA